MLMTFGTIARANRTVAGLRLAVLGAVTLVLASAIGTTPAHAQNNPPPLPEQLNTYLRACAPIAAV
jgi:hypothetical protein